MSHGEIVFLRIILLDIGIVFCCEIFWGIASYIVLPNTNCDEILIRWPHLVGRMARIVGTPEREVFRKAGKHLSLFEVISYIFDKYQLTTLSD